MVLMKVPCEGEKISKRSLLGGKYEIFKAAFNSCVGVYLLRVTFHCLICFVTSKDGHVGRGR